MSLRSSTTSRRAVLRRRALAGMAVLALGIASGARPRGVAATRDGRAAIDPRVRTAVAAGRAVTVLAVLRDQADVAAARDIAGRSAKGRFVFERLVRTAEGTQRPLRALLERRGAAYEPYFVVNAVAFEADGPTVAAVAGLTDVAGIVLLPKFAIDPAWAGGAAQGTAAGPAGAAVEAAVDGAAPRRANDVAVAERNIKAIGADKVWRQGFLGAGATVAIIDTGVNVRHAALSGRYRGRDEGHDHNWLDAVAGQDAPIDVNDHGTHVAGIVLGKQGSREVGVAPEAEWIACRIFAQTSGGTKEILDCLQWALAPTKRDGSDPRPDRAPDVVNASWGIFGRLFCDNPFPAEAAIRNLVAAGILFVAASGNDGPRCGSVCPPGALDIAFTVGNYDDERREITASSSRGPFVQGGTERIKPDVAAPGVNINSSVGTSGFDVKQGTSMAAPHVAGAAALVLSARPDLRGRPAALRALLEDTADPLNADQCGPSGARDFNNSAGHGVIDVEAAVAAALGLPTATATATAAPRPTASPTPAASATARASATSAPTTPAAPTTATPAATASPGPSASARATASSVPTASRPTATATGVEATSNVPIRRIHLPYASR